MPDYFQFSLIKEEAANWLKRMSDEEDVKVAALELSGDGAPGPDGFPSAFFSTILGGDQNGCDSIYEGVPRER